MAPIKTFLITQVLVILVVSTIVVLGDHTKIRAVLQSSNVSINQPLIITFNLPLKESTVEIHLLHDGTNVPGTVSWSSRALAFLPDQELAYDTVYQLWVTSAEDTEGHELSSAIMYNIHTDPARFLYLTPTGILARYDLSNKTTSSLTPYTERVTDYAVSSDGTSILFTYTKRNDPLVNGFAEITDGVHVIDEGASAYYSLPRICDTDRYALILKGVFSADQTVKNAELLQIPLQPSLDYQHSNVLAQGESWVGATDVSCTEASDQVAYRDNGGTVTLNALQTPAVQTLGVYQTLYGFTPKGDQLIVSVASGGGYLNRQLISILQSGERRSLGDPSADSQDPSFAPNENILAASINSTWLNQSTNFAVTFYEKQQGVTETAQIPLIGNYSDQHPIWSPDGNSIIYEHISEDASGSRVSDGLGNYIDGELWLASLPPAQHLYLAKLTAKSLGISGSHISWMP